MSSSTITILLADDDADDRQLLEEALTQIEPTLKVHSVSTGKEVITYLQRCIPAQFPCLIVLDYNMPGLNGPEVLKKLCDSDTFLSIPKIVWSTSDAPHYREICEANGALSYFQKPLHFRDMVLLAKEMIAICKSKISAQ